jgi:TPR repeat protein
MDHQQLAIKYYQTARQYETEWSRNQSKLNKLASAVDLYHRSADLNNPDAQYTLATLYFIGRGVLENNELALEYYKLAADNGHPYARKEANSLEKNLKEINMQAAHENPQIHIQKNSNENIQKKKQERNLYFKSNNLQPVKNAIRASQAIQKEYTQKMQTSLTPYLGGHRSRRTRTRNDRKRRTRKH